MEMKLLLAVCDNDDDVDGNVVGAGNVDDAVDDADDDNVRG